MLAPCPSCRRHVDVASHACPFCGAACAGLVARTPPRGRFSRKSLATVASALAIAGCGADDRAVANVDSGPDVATDTGSNADSGSSSDSGSLSDSGSESDSDSGSMSDSESDVHDSGGALPPYGLPPSDGG